MHDATKLLKGSLRRIENEAEVRKLSQLTPLGKAKRARYFILLCGISCELAGCVHRLRVHDSRLRPLRKNQNSCLSTCAIYQQLEGTVAHS